MVVVATVYELPRVVTVGVVAGGGDEHNAAGHGVLRGQRNQTVLEIRFSVVAKIVDDDIGALAVEGLVGQPENGLHHVQGGLRPGEGQAGAGGQVVDDFQQRRPLVIRPGIVRVDLDAVREVVAAL